LEGLLAVVDLEVTTGIQDWYRYGEMEGEIPDFRGCNSEAASDLPSYG